jgi:hypothetical protein
MPPQAQSILPAVDADLLHLTILPCLAVSGEDHNAVYRQAQASCDSP